MTDVFEWSNYSRVNISVIQNWTKRQKEGGNSLS